MLGLLPVSLGGPRHSFHGSSRFMRRAAKSSLGGGIYAFTGMAGHVELVIEFFTNFGFGLLPLVGFEDCRCLFSRLPSRKVVSE